MQFRSIETGAILEETSFRALFLPATTFPTPITDLNIEGTGFEVYEAPPAPSYVPTQEEIEAASREAAKADRQLIVDAIKVTTSTGKVFDGDEISQGRMARAIIWLQATGLESVTWVLADNTVTQATQAELTEALCLAGARQAELWVLP